MLKTLLYSASLPMVTLTLMVFVAAKSGLVY